MKKMMNIKTTPNFTLFYFTLHPLPFFYPFLTDQGVGLGALGMGLTTSGWGVDICPNCWGGSHVWAAC